MKNKPVKHKSENTFRFQTFSERLSSINVDVIHRVALRRGNTPFESETFFEEALNKWAELNCTQDFDKLRYDIGGDIHTLPQIVVLTPLVRYAARLEDESDVLALLTEVVLRRRPVDLARPGGSGGRPLFDTGCSAVVTLSRVVARMLSLEVAGSLERVWAGLVCLPHFA
ncbi:unnamed protein product [Ixodes persulcatus]